MNLNNEDVIKFVSVAKVSSLSAKSPTTITVVDLIKTLTYGLPDDYFTGHECKVLAEGKPWQSGKFRICLEFIPDLEDELQQLEKEIERD